MKREEYLLIEIIRAVLAGAINSESFSQLSSEETGAVIACAKKHGLLPFLQECPAFVRGPHQKQLGLYLKRYAYQDIRQTYQAEQLFERFEQEGIECIPLKGICTKRFYPSPELRTMGDLDLLYKEEQTGLLKRVMEDMGYELEGHSIKHDHYEKENLTVEMHRELLSAQSRAFTYFQNVWERAKPIKGKQYLYEMCIEDHYLFTLYHLIEHFIRGGIGIRMVLDIYVLSRLSQMDWGYVDKELNKLEINRFEQNIRHLAEMWFAPEGNGCDGHQNAEGSQTAKCEQQKYAGMSKQTDEHRKNTEEIEYGSELKELEDYILSGGIFGSTETERRNGTVMYQSRAKLFQNLVFPSYATMKTSFPWLKTPLLLPAAWIMRYHLVWTKRRKSFGRHWRRFQAFGDVDKAERMERQQFFEKYGLKDMF